MAARTSALIFQSIIQFSILAVSLPLSSLPNSQIPSSHTENLSYFHQNKYKTQVTMATRAFPFGKIRIHADPDPCKDFFEDLKHKLQNSQVIGLGNPPTKDDLSWAIQKCPNSIDALADILGLNQKDQDFETSMGRIGKVLK